MKIDPLRGVLKDTVGYLIFSNNIVCGTSERFKTMSCYKAGVDEGFGSKEIDAALARADIIWRRRNDTKTNRKRGYTHKECARD